MVEPPQTLVEEAVVRYWQAELHAHGVDGIGEM